MRFQFVASQWNAKVKMHDTWARMLLAAAALVFLAVTADARGSRQARCEFRTRCVAVDSCPDIDRLIASPDAHNTRKGPAGPNHSGEEVKRVCCDDDLTNITTSLTTTASEVAVPKDDPLLTRECGFGARLKREYAAPGDYPWQALLGYSDSSSGNKSPTWDCGGALITSRHVLTAAHCAATENATGRKLVVVRLGEFNLTSRIDCLIGTCLLPHEDFLPEAVIIHPHYGSPSPRANDLALVKLDREAVNRYGISPVCLPPEDLQLESYYRYGGLETPGWGTVGFRGPASEDLQSGSVTLVSLSLCKGREAREEVVFVEGKPTGFGDPCFGDTGGPLTTEFARNTLIGIHAFGNVCGLAAYTNVAKYTPWIIENLRY
ncbi:venom protease-like isoform X2 [Penaeus chinensis]|uniref:venom protease-like isoform X2 n=1 Tax=Penaeus chinensis TaxID=139456 RepID=UPI001FB75645|nr:venom protease-like isoform X2 [Penaeus chinensis]